MSARVVGIDIGTDAVRAVELSDAASAQPTLLRYLEEPLPAGAVSRGEVVEPHAVGAALKRLWTVGGFTTKDVVLGMGNHRVVARNLTVPRMSIRRIRESLPFQVQELLSYPVADALLDFYPIAEVPAVGDTGPQVNGLLIAAVKSIVLANTRAARLAGLTAIEVDLIPFALSRAVYRGAQSGETFALIDVGAGTTSVLISAGEEPQFVRLIPTGGNDLTKALKQRLGLGEEQAEAIKRSVGMVDTVEPADADAAAVIREVTSDLLNSLRNTISYFGNTRPDLPVVRIVLTGGGSRLPGFAEALGELARLPVHRPEPAGVTLGNGVSAEALRDSQGTFLVALGLALGSKA